MIETTPNTCNDGNWHYAVVTYDSPTLRLYVDGLLVSSLNTNAAPDYNWNAPFSFTVLNTTSTNVASKICFINNIC